MLSVVKTNREFNSSTRRGHINPKNSETVASNIAIVHTAYPQSRTDKL